MIRRLALIADDLTGALDTSVQFLDNCISPYVLIDFSDLYTADLSSYDCVVINTDSRHLGAEEAGKRVAEAVRCVRLAGFDTVYKKTDSVLRGNIGSELEATLTAMESDCMVLAPAYPMQKRYTRQGKQYIGETLISETEFSKDPLDPVTTSFVPEIVARQSNLPVINLHNGCWPKEQPKGPVILLYDAETDADLDGIAALIDQHNVHCLAGCAGLAAHLPLQADDLIDVDAVAFPEQPLLVISGSKMSTSLRQIQEAQKSGFEQVELQDTDKNGVACGGQNARDEILAMHRAGKDLVVCMSEEFRNRETEQMGSLDVADTLASLADSLLSAVHDLMLMIIGGDTLLATLHAIGATAAEPIAEIVSGVVLIRVKSRHGSHLIISKSGGLGRQDALLTVRRFLREHSIEYGEKCRGLRYMREE